MAAENRDQNLSEDEGSGTSIILEEGPSTEQAEEVPAESATVEAEEGSEAAAEEEEPAEAELGKKGLAELKEQRRKRQEAELRVARLEGELAARAVAAPAPIPSTAKQPEVLKLEDFESYEAYQEAVLNQRLVAAEQRMQSEVGSKIAATIKQQAFESRVQSYAVKHPEILDAVKDPSLPISAVMSDIIKESDQAPEIILHLKNNPADALRIYNLSPVLAAKEIGKIEVKVSQPPVKTRKVSQAPEPITPVASGKGAPIVDEDDLSDADWLKRRREHVHGR